MITDMDIAAFADNELPESRRDAVEAAMAANPVLAQRLAAHRELRRKAEAAFTDVVDEPIPQRFLDTIREANVVRPDFKTRSRRSRPWVAVGGSLAAGLALGIVVANGIGQRDIIRPSAGGLQAAGILAVALDRQLSTETQGPVRVGFSFARSDRSVCRTFAISKNSLAGLACHNGGRWDIAATAAQPQTDHAEYKTAGSDTPAEVLAAVDSRIDGEAFNLEQETAARARGWSR